MILLSTGQEPYLKVLGLGLEVCALGIEILVLISHFWSWQLLTMQ